MEDNDDGDDDDDSAPRWTCKRSLAISRGDVRNDAIAPALALDTMVNERGSFVVVVVSFTVDVVMV